MMALGAAWGIQDATALEASKPDLIFKSVEQCKSFLLKKVG